MVVNGTVKDPVYTEKMLLTGYLSDGLTLAQIGKKEGVSKQAISYRLKKHHLKPNQDHSKKGKKKKVKSSQTNKNTTPHLSHPPQNTPGQDGANLPGTPLKLTEEILETALVHALRDDPIKAIGPALQFLDKKKGLSIEGADTKQSLIAADKLKSIRKDMFS